MKITAIVASETKLGQITMRTEPPLTDEIFEFAREHIWDPQTREEFLLDTGNGQLTIYRSLLSKDDITHIETALSQAEKEIAQQKDSAEKEHEGFLQRVSKNTGLPLE